MFFRRSHLPAIARCLGLFRVLQPLALVGSESRPGGETLLGKDALAGVWDGGRAHGQAWGQRLHGALGVAQLHVGALEGRNIDVR